MLGGKASSVRHSKVTFAVLEISLEFQPVYWYVSLLPPAWVGLLDKGTILESSYLTPVEEFLTRRERHFVNSTALPSLPHWESAYNYDVF